MSTTVKRQLFLSTALLLIILGIFYLDSLKATPADISNVNSDINVEDIVLGTTTNEITEDPIDITSEPKDPTPIVEDKKTVIDFLDEGKEDPVIKATEERIAAKALKYEVGKEISTPDGFINVENINITDLIGEKIILVDFWTYSCINCQRTIPFLNSWHEKYAKDGLVILGLHTPEFEFEKEYENVERAVRKFGIQYPVILDNDYSTWRSYKNRYWPRKYLIDIDGFIVYDHIGEGSYDETEQKIVELLNERMEVLGEKKKVALNTAAPDNVDTVNFSKVRSPETYLGSSRIEFIGNLPSLDCFGQSCSFFLGQQQDVELNTYQLDGTWQINGEESTLKSDSGSIFIRFSASKVNLVAGSENDVRAEVYLDGDLVSTEKAGAHMIDGVVTFNTHDLYNLIDLRGNYGEHLLEIRFFDSGVSAFAFTFG